MGTHSLSNHAMGSVSTRRHGIATAPDEQYNSKSRLQWDIRRKGVCNCRQPGSHSLSILSIVGRAESVQGLNDKMKEFKAKKRLSSRLIGLLNDGPLSRLRKS
jgi:hypothetical protein